ncbi:DUF805 domain-containing protein [Rubellimicrobium aerolatum]|uniref:DUF805 domain-containing protein n=1 Tax=Rubellimicrobium aerolatum TaxID=490979 RepID=A0ABW0S7W1_9RHOB|nr:DUF805 domain-containing protein [Rubellimicrobium aerolatum]MBP1804454.1 uncharacterized membrane protein YhaH (DUF805 family) [Rubellimicrobium aerolatum]
MSIHEGTPRDYHERVGPGEALRRAFANYATFRGRANRGEYWWFMVANVLVSVGLGLVDLGLFGADRTVLSGLWSLAVILPSLAVGARRLHDTDRSGWWLLIGLVPVVGVIVLIVLFALRGDSRPNRFG